MNNQRIVKLLDLRYDNVHNIASTRSKKKTVFFFKNTSFMTVASYMNVEWQSLNFNKKETKLQKKEMDKWYVVGPISLARRVIMSMHDTPYVWGVYWFIGRIKVCHLTSTLHMHGRHGQNILSHGEVTLKSAFNYMVNLGKVGGVHHLPHTTEKMRKY